MFRFCTIALLVVLFPLYTGCGATAQTPRVYSDTDSALGDAQARTMIQPVIDQQDLATSLRKAVYIEYPDYSVTALLPGGETDSQVIGALELDQKADVLQIWITEPIDSAALYIKYDPAIRRYASTDVEADNAIGFSCLVERGLLSIGMVGLNGKNLDAGTRLVTINFAAGPEQIVRRAVSVSQAQTTAVRDLTVSYSGTGNATLSWSERHTGDYNLDGLVSANDLTPIGFWYQRQVDELDEDYARIEVVDGNEDGFITMNDITQIGQNFGSHLAGYNVYRYRLETQAQEPDLDDDGWVKVENNVGADEPSASREGMFNGQKTRLSWVFIDELDSQGYYAWYVAPAGTPGDKPAEGKPSNIAKPGGGSLPEGTLTFEVVPPLDGMPVFTDQELFVGIKAENVIDLFSANVRFEYDASMLRFIYAQSFIDTGTVRYENLLAAPSSQQPDYCNPLFAAQDVGESSANDGYRVIGLNATKWRGEQPCSGTGYLGYIRFKALDSKANPECLRFPQTSTFIYMWGDNYGVPVMTPRLGESMELVISE